MVAKVPAGGNGCPVPSAMWLHRNQSGPDGQRRHLRVWILQQTCRQLGGESGLKRGPSDLPPVPRWSHAPTLGQHRKRQRAALTMTRIMKNPSPHRDELGRPRGPHKSRGRVSHRSHAFAFPKVAAWWKRRLPLSTAMPTDIPIL